MAKGLKTKLNFHFETGDLEVPEMNFLIGDPPEPEKNEIKIIKKTGRKKKKSNPKLF